MRHGVCMGCWTSILLPTTRSILWATSAPSQVRSLYHIILTRTSHNPPFSYISTHLLHDPNPLAKLTHPTDISHYGWVASAGWAGVNIDDFPTLKAWEERMTARPGVEKGRHVPDPHTIKELLKDPAKMEEHAAKSRAWVQAGMKQDAEKSSGK